MKPTTLSLATTALAALATLAGSPAEAQFSVRPASLRLAAEAAAEEATLHVRNEGTAALEFRVYLADFEQEEGGAHAFTEPGTNPRSCAARLRVTPEAVSLLPGEEQAVTVRMEPGEGTCWSLVFVESVAVGEGGVRFGQRVGVKTFGATAAAPREGSVSAVSAAADADALRVEMTFRNESTVPLLPEGKVEIRTFTGEVVAEVPVAAFTALPGRVRRVEVAWPGRLPAGQYLAVPILDFGGDYLAAGQTDFRIR